MNNRKENKIPENSIEDIELRSREVQEVLSRPPGVLMRWGTTILFVFTILLFTGGTLFRYPDMIRADITITSEFSEANGRVLNGKIFFPASGAGKVKAGQKVSILVTGYPYPEFGNLPGKVESISIQTEDSVFFALISLPKDLITSKGYRIKFNDLLTGTANIITGERSLVDRIIAPLKNSFKNSL